MAARGASARTDRLAPQTTREPMRRMWLQGGARARQEQPVDGGSRTQCEWVPCVGSPCNGALLRASRGESVIAVTVTVAFRGSNITGRGATTVLRLPPAPPGPGGSGNANGARP